MNNSFASWKKKHDGDDLEQFNYDPEGQLWLKLKSIVRKELLVEFITKYSIDIESNTLTKQFEELFTILAKNVEESHNKLNIFIKEKNQQIIKELDQDRLVSELYKLQVFEWGGDYQNSLDKYLVSHYVKVISSFDVLMSKFDHEINRTVQGYVINSWFNHWSSILIEHIFKSHSFVLPTVGKIKNVDFFINDIPFDLKVTYFPSEFLKQKRREKGLPVELTFLKSKAKELGIIYNSENNLSQIYYEICEKMKDRGDRASLNILAELKNGNMEIVNEAINNPSILAKWLYEKQGEMRFGAENRLFLVLIDTDNFSSSWKLKRNIELLRPTIFKFLDSFHNKNIDDIKIEFTYPGKPQIFKPLSDIIFVVKQNFSTSGQPKILT